MDLETRTETCHGDLGSGKSYLTHLINSYFKQYNTKFNIVGEGFYGTVVF